MERSRRNLRVTMVRPEGGAALLDIGRRHVLYASRATIAALTPIAVRPPLDADQVRVPGTFPTALLDDLLLLPRGRGMRAPPT